MTEELCGWFIADQVLSIAELLREEVVHFTSHVQNVADARKKKNKILQILENKLVAHELVIVGSIPLVAQIEVVEYLTRLLHLPQNH